MLNSEVTYCIVEALLVDTLINEWLDFYLAKTCHFHKTLSQFPNECCMFTFPCL